MLIVNSIVSYKETKLEKLFVLARFVAGKNLLPEVGLQLPELRGDISLQYYRLEKTYEGDIPVTGEGRSLIAQDEIDKSKVPDVLTTLSNVIQTINEKFRGYVRITDADKLTILEWQENLEKDPELRNIAKANELEDFLRIYEKKLQEQMVNSLSDNYYLVSSIFSNPDLMKEITIRAASRYHEWASSNDLPPIRPGSPAENRLSFRQIIQSCKGFLYWMDLFIGKEGLEFLIDSFDHQNIKEIKIFTSLYNNENQINAELRDRFEEFQKEMKQKGISLEMRLVSTRNEYDRVAHDRFIIGENIKYNVPSFTTIKKGRFSEIKRTTNDIPFKDYWNDKDCLDITKDWSKIKEILDKTINVTYNTICPTCGKEFQSSFKPSSSRPVYCPDCWKKTRKY
jgi:type I restriction enzyme R subunit